MKIAYIKMKSHVWMLKEDEIIMTFIETWQDITLRAKCTWYQDLSCLMMWRYTCHFIICLVHYSHPCWPLTIWIWSNWNGCPNLQAGLASLCPYLTCLKLWMLSILGAGSVKFKILIWFIIFVTFDSNTNFKFVQIKEETTNLIVFSLFIR